MAPVLTRIESWSGSQIDGAFICSVPFCVRVDLRAYSARRTKYKKHHGVLPEKPEAAVKATAEKRQNARANAKKKGTQSPRSRGSSSMQL